MQAVEPKPTCVPGYQCSVVPILLRRRRLGAVIVSYAVRGLADGEELARFCQANRLDKALTLRASVQEARFDASQADTVRQIVRLLIDDASERHAASNEIAALSADLSGTYEELSLVYKIAAGMTVTERPDEYLRNIGIELLEVVGAESLALRFFPHDQPLDSQHISLGAELTSPTAEERLWDELLARFETRTDPIVDNMLAGESDQFRSLAGSRVRRLVAVPMVRNGRLIGAILAMNKVRGDFDSTDIKLIKSVADEAAVFTENAFLYEDLQQLLIGMLRALTSSIDAKDPYTCGHSERVALIASRIAASAGLDAYTVGRIYLAGLLHDIGKIGVPEAVLTKPGRLTADEFGQMKKHPEVGAHILSGIKQVQDLVAGVLYHHERMDGKGYPQKLAGPAVPMFGRIVGLADCFDAMTSDRTYRRALPLEATLAEIRRCAGTQFDPRIVEAFLRLDPAELLRQARSGDTVDSLNSLVRQARPGPVGA
jgi:GAF domain-containing protein